MSPITLQQIFEVGGWTQTDILAYGIMLGVPLATGAIIVAALTFRRGNFRRRK
jgi:hypothetical protein